MRMPINKNLLLNDFLINKSSKAWKFFVTNKFGEEIMHGTLDEIIKNEFPKLNRYQSTPVQEVIPTLYAGEMVIVLLTPINYRLKKLKVGK